MQSANSEYGSPYLAVCHITFFRGPKSENYLSLEINSFYSIQTVKIIVNSILCNSFLIKNVETNRSRILTECSFYFLHFTRIHMNSQPVKWFLQRFRI